MTDPTEQTADATILGLLTIAFGDKITFDDVGVLKGLLEEFGAKAIVETSVARLREDLAIAARVRACPDTYPFDPASVSEDYLDGWDALLGWLLNGDTP